MQLRYWNGWGTNCSVEIELHADLIPEGFIIQFNLSLRTLCNTYERAMIIRLLYKDERGE